MHTAAEQVANVGLSTIEAAARLREYGRNELPEPPSPTLVRRLARSLRDPLVLVLLTALGLTILVGDLTDATVIALVVVVNSGIGLRQDVKADQMVRALARLAATRAWVIRSGQPNEVPVAEIVPGDLLMLRRGDLVPADAVLVEGSGVQVDESMLTGESVPVDRFATTDPGPDRMPRVPPVPGAGAQPADDLARLLSGTVVLHGHGLARVTATGAAGAVGRLAALMVTVPAATPLQRRMARLSAQLAVAAVALSVVVLGIGLAQGQPLERMVLATIALVVAAVPESLPLVVTVSLAMAARRMAAQHALVRNLSAVETLGSVTLLATDKTGTLTQGSMAVAETWHPASVSTEDLMRALVLCNDAAVDPASGRSHGDPTENALLAVAQASGLDAEALRTAYPRIGEAPFDSTRKAMTTIHRDPLGSRLVVRKGAPEVLLAPGSVVGSAAVVEEARSRAESWARRGIRVIAVAEVHGPSGDSEIASEGARLLGLVGLVDPIRDTSAQTVADCRAAGLRVVLITGDHPSTADAVAAEVGIGDGAPAVALATETDPSPDVGGDVIARATPADKYALVRAYQAAGHVVAMTGDGVNDAPALRAADIGVAMGERGTEVARQAADLVLADDNLGTLVAAVEEGRRVYANIRRFLVYGLAGGCSEVLLMLAGPAINVPLPLLPAQILWLNLLTHSFAGAGLAVQPGDALALGRGPRPPTQGPLAAGLWWRTLVIAAYLAAVSLVALWASPVQPAQSAALLTLGAGQLAVAWGVRTARPTFWRPGDRVDPLIPALFTAGAMLIASITVGPLRDLLGTQPVDAATWARAGAAAVGAWALTRALRTRSL